jgi:hypothetical protein
MPDKRDLKPGRRTIPTSKNVFSRIFSSVTVSRCVRPSMSGQYSSNTGVSGTAARKETARKASSPAQHLGKQAPFVYP